VVSASIQRGITVKRALLALLIAGITTQANAYEFTAGGTVVAGEGKYSSVLGAVTTSFNSGTLPSNYSGGLVLIGTHPFALPPGGESSFYYEPLNAPETASLARSRVTLATFGALRMMAITLNYCAEVMLLPHLQAPSLRTQPVFV
jgi:hypothetical protein